MHTGTANGTSVAPCPDTVLRAAVSAAADGFTSLDGRAPECRLEAKRILNTLAVTVLPVLDQVVDAALADRNGQLTAVLTFLRNAVTKLEAGQIEAARTAVCTAHVALARPDWYSAGQRLAPAHR